MWPRSMRFRGVFIGIVIGSGVVGLLVAWTNEDFYITTSTPTIGPGKNGYYKLYLQMPPLCGYVSLEFAYRISFFLSLNM